MCSRVPAHKAPSPERDRWPIHMIEKNRAIRNWAVITLSVLTSWFAWIPYYFEVVQNRPPPNSTQGGLGLAFAMVGVGYLGSISFLVVGIISSIVGRNWRPILGVLCGIGLYVPGIMLSMLLGGIIDLGASVLIQLPRTGYWFAFPITLLVTNLIWNLKESERWPTIASTVPLNRDGSTSG